MHLADHLAVLVIRPSKIWENVDTSQYEIRFISQKAVIDCIKEIKYKKKHDNSIATLLCQFSRIGVLSHPVFCISKMKLCCVKKFVLFVIDVSPL